MKFSNLLIIIFLFQFQATYTQVDTIKYGLKGKVIRALASSPANPSVFYAGLKGSALGSALIYTSVDAGKTWSTLNAGQPISPYAADIQAIAEAQDETSTIFAGTWKDGLHKSIDAGRTWARVESAPSSDIRSLKTGIQTPGLVYAATSSFGVMKSIDGGATWQRNHPTVIDSTFKFAWSIEIDERDDKIIFAQTYSKGIWKSTDQGATWQQALDVKDKVCWDLKLSGNSVWVASSKSRDSISLIHYSEDLGETWAEIEDVPQIGVSQINVIEQEGQQVLFVGSWSDGIHMLKEDSWSKVEQIDYDVISEILPNKSMRNEIIIGSWGNGIYNLKL